MSNSEVLAFGAGARRRHDVAAWVLCFAAVAGLYAYLPQIVHSVRMWTWPTVSGQILSQDANTELVYVEIHRYGNSNVTEHRLHVRYAYAVSGQSYIGTSIGSVRPWVHDYRSERSRLAVGKEVTVHYDAASPSDAVLDVAPPMDAVLWSSLSIAALVWAARRSLRKKRHSAMRVGLATFTLSALASGVATTRAEAQRYPGARFHCSAPQVHHGAMRTTWVFRKPDGSEVAHGMDFFELAGDGRIRRVTGFFGDPPVARP